MLRNGDRGEPVRADLSARREAAGLVSGVPHLEGQDDPLVWVKAVYKARRIREEMFGPSIFADPSWDILLDLYRAHREGRRITVSSACTASCVPATTALRYIAGLCDRGLLCRRPSSDDHRLVYLELSETAIATMERWFSKVKAMSDDLARASRTR